MRIAVTDGNTRAALAVTRSLGKAGHWVAVGEESPRSLAGTSKYCADSFGYPSPKTNLTTSMTELALQLKRQDIEMLIPVAEKTLLPLLKYREQFFDDIRIPFPDYDTLSAVTDKFRVFKLAKEIGVPIPPTVFIEQYSDWVVNECEKLKFPVVLKPGRSIIVEEDRLIETGISYAHSLEDIRAVCEQKQYFQKYPFLVQERVVGPGIGYFVLLVDGEIIAEFSHFRIREKPPSGGVSAYSESIAVRDDIREYSVKLLRALKWNGIAMVEFKLDERADTPMLMEINPRFWGSLQLAIDSGVDFPKLLVDCLSDEACVAVNGRYREGHRWRWLLGDLDNLLLRTMKSRNGLCLPPGYPSKTRAGVDFLKTFFDRNMSYDVLKRDDIRPFLFELRTYVKDLLG